MLSNRKLYEAVAKGHLEQSGNALLLAARNGKTEMVEWLLKNGASLSEKDNYGYTALLGAASNGKTETVKWLLDHGASLSEKDNDGYTALLRAARNGKTETVEWLLENGAGIGQSLEGIEFSFIDKKVWKDKVIVGLKIGKKNVEEMPESEVPGAIRTIDELNKKKDSIHHYGKLIRACNQLLSADLEITTEKTVLNSQLRKKLVFHSNAGLKTCCLMFFNRPENEALKQKVL